MMGECVIVTLKVCGGKKVLLKGDPVIQDQPGEETGGPEGETRASSCTSSSPSVCFRFSDAVESCTCGGSCAGVYE